MSAELLRRSDVLSASEASDLLGIPKSTLYELARRGDLPARRIGRRWVFRRSLLDRATLPPTEPDSWRSAPLRAVQSTGPLPATVARSESGSSRLPR